MDSAIQLLNNWGHDFGQIYRLSTSLTLTHAVNVVKKCAPRDTLSNLFYASDLHIFFSQTSPSSEKQRKDKAAIVKPLFGTDIYPECKVMLKVTL